MSSNFLHYIPLGGVATTLNKNLHVYETKDDLVIVDCGVAFPEDEDFGVDVIIPDVHYLKDKTKKIRGIVITHGNYDHFAALAYVLPEIGFPPIYTAKMTREFIKLHLKEHNLLEGQRIHLIDPEKDSFELGAFRITPFRVNHSVPDTMGLFMETPVGKIVHTPDFKFDWTPVDGKKFAVQKLATLCKDGVLCLMSDSLGSTQDGYALSERFIKPTLAKYISEATGQVFVTMISSNISRIQQIVDVSVEAGRKVATLGRSVSQNVEMARGIGYLKAPKGTFVSSRTARDLKPHQRAYLIAGSFGQPRSALGRLARGDSRDARLKKDDLVIFSSRPIPGTYDQVDKVIDLLTAAGAHVIYSEIQEALHTSGHGSRGDLALLANIVEPQYFVPTGGTFKHMRAFSFLMEELGYRRERVFELKEGDVLEFGNGTPKIAGRVKTRKKFVDGYLVGDVGRKVLGDRKSLAEGGVLVVVVPIDAKRRILKGNVEIVTRGFVFVKESQKLIALLRGMVEKTVEENKNKLGDHQYVRTKIYDELNSFIYKKLGRSPMILPVLVEF
jgi:ribonuclease J